MTKKNKKDFSKTFRTHKPYTTMGLGKFFHKLTHAVSSFAGHSAHKVAGFARMTGHGIAGFANMTAHTANTAVHRFTGFTKDVVKKTMNTAKHLAHAAASSAKGAAKWAKHFVGAPFKGVGQAFDWVKDIVMLMAMAAGIWVYIGYKAAPYAIAAATGPAGAALL
jgi:hypothetical protein